MAREKVIKTHSYVNRHRARVTTTPSPVTMVATAAAPGATTGAAAWAYTLADETVTKASGELLWYTHILWVAWMLQPWHASKEGYPSTLAIQRQSWHS